MGALNILLGIWVAVSPWLLNYATAAATTSSVIFGIAIIVFSLIREAAPDTLWPSWVNFALGIWLIVSPFILQLNTAAAYWSLIVSGVIVAVLSYSNTQLHTVHPAM
jgi:hypothetical protein